MLIYDTLVDARLQQRENMTQTLTLRNSAEGFFFFLVLYHLFWLKGQIGGQRSVRSLNLGLVQPSEEGRNRF